MPSYTGYKFAKIYMSGFKSAPIDKLTLAKKEFNAIGELKLIENRDELNFQMIFENSWESDIKKII